MEKTQAYRFAVFLKALLARLGWTNSEIEDRGGTTREVVGRHLRAAEDPKAERVPQEVGRSSRMKYAAAFGCDADQFEGYWFKADQAIKARDTGTLEEIVGEVVARVQPGGDGLPAGYSHDPLLKPVHERSGWLSVIGPAAAGKPTDFEHNVLADRDIPGTLYHAPQEYPCAIIASGDSMAPLIKNNDLVIIARKFWRAPKSGDIVAVTFTQERGHTIKWLEIMPDGRWKLTPQNSESGPPITYNPAEIKAAAVVVGYYHGFHHPRRSAR